MWVALFDISIVNISTSIKYRIDCNLAYRTAIPFQYIDKKYRLSIYRHLKNIDIDKENLQNIDIDKISNRLEFGISNKAKCGI